MDSMPYICRQEITVIEDFETCDRVTSELIFTQKVLGVDCECIPAQSKISMIQVATCDDVFLFRITKFADKQIPESLHDILQDSDIIKVGVNIGNDASKLRKHYQCNLKRWVDLRNLAVASPKSYGKVLLKRLQKFEEELASLYPEGNEDEKKDKRFSWYPKLCLGSLTEDCLGVQLQKGSTARWQGDWESEELSQEQINYAAADAAAALDIFYALMAEKDLGVPFSVLEMEIVPDKTQLTNFCGRVIEKKVKEKSLVKQCYSLIAAIDKEFDLTDYLTKPAHKNKVKRVKLTAGKPLDGSDFCWREKVNECCCCYSRTDELVRKTVIPKEYRKHLPPEFKDDVLLLCFQCDISSNMFDNKMREELATEHGIPINPINYINNGIVLDKTKNSVRAAAKALTSTNNKIPEEKKQVLKQTITDYLGHEPTTEEIVELKYIPVNGMKYAGSIPDHGSEVVKRVMDQGKVEEFILRWRNFFLSSMKPEYRLKGRSVNHKSGDKFYNEKETNEAEMEANQFEGKEERETNEGKLEEEVMEAEQNKFKVDDCNLGIENMSVD